MVTAWRVHGASVPRLQLPASLHYPNREPSKGWLLVACEGGGGPVLSSRREVQSPHPSSRQRVVEIAELTVAQHEWMEDLHAWVPMAGARRLPEGGRGRGRQSP